MSSKDDTPMYVTIHLLTYFGYVTVSYIRRVQVQYCSNYNAGKLLVSSLNSTHEIWNGTQRRREIEKDRDLNVSAVKTFIGHTNTRHSVGAAIPNNCAVSHPNMLVSGSETAEVLVIMKMYCNRRT